MKKNITTILACFSLITTSCVFDETLEQLIQKVEPAQSLQNDVQSRASNAIILDSSGKTYYNYIELENTDGNPITCNLSDEYNYTIYMYSGAGGTFLLDENRPAIQYKQVKNDIYADKFNYTVMTSEEMAGNSSITFQDAFANLSFGVINRMENLFLEIREINIFNIAREGKFLFPFNGSGACWKQSGQDDFISIKTDTIGIHPQDSIDICIENSVPVIPQSLSPWNPYGLPHKGEGSYILLGCRIFNICDAQRGYQENYDVPIWCCNDGGFAYAAIPFQNEWLIGGKHKINIILQHGCEWYNINGLIPSKILQPIIFDATVEDWKDK